MKLQITCYPIDRLMVDREGIEPGDSDIGDPFERPGLRGVADERAEPHRPFGPDDDVIPKHAPGYDVLLSGEDIFARVVGRRSGPVGVVLDVGEPDALAAECA